MPVKVGLDGRKSRILLTMTAADDLKDKILDLADVYTEIMAIAPFTSIQLRTDMASPYVFLKFGLPVALQSLFPVEDKENCSNSELQNAEADDVDSPKILEASALEATFPE
ncbi:hypothetical protein TcWFU_005544 [Taenia crassiceps]|uniref:Uncharacterized protein n=1 Tax=Taenia crassiceps TaxID=6207 RepID=A0ABR4QL98_9CEST